MAKLWKKTDVKLDPTIERYTAGTDHVFDTELMPFDILATRAHAQGLKKIGILSASELQKLLNALDSLAKEWAAGKLRIKSEDEDCHTVIENYLVKKTGSIGKKIHTGRSRNDQVLTATRLYMKSNLQTLQKDCVHLAEQFLAVAKKYERVPMPGYSHTRQAMLSTVGHYFAAFAESLLDDADLLASVRTHIDKNPLGSAAGFGTSIPIDRDFTTKQLGFASVQLNTLYSQNSRGKFESTYMEALAQVMLTLSKFGTDMLLFTSHEFDLFSVDESLTTGSSIMPHKRNLDALEIVRGNVSVVIADQLMIKTIAKDLMSGYNRDTQLTKKPLIESTHIVADSLKVVGIVLAGLRPKEKSIRDKIHKGIFTADTANQLVMERGIPFRDAYRLAADASVSDIDLKKNIASKKSVGAPGNLALYLLEKRAKRSRTG